MLKKLQKVRDIVEEVSYIYADIDNCLLQCLKEFDKTDYERIIELCSIIEEKCNDLIHKDIGLCDYIDTHARVINLVALLNGSEAYAVKEWKTQLFHADISCLEYIYSIEE